jgi:hypothetical protein
VFCSFAHVVGLARRNQKSTSSVGAARKWCVAHVLTAHAASRATMTGSLGTVAQKHVVISYSARPFVAGLGEKVASAAGRVCCKTGRQAVRSTWRLRGGDEKSGLE